MERKTESRMISGMEVRAQQLPAMKALGLLTRLGRVLGPALAKAGDIPELSLEMDTSDLAPVIGELFSATDDDQVVALTKQILACTSVIADEKIYHLCDRGAVDDVFAGDLMALLQTIAFTLKVNYGDFFAALGAGKNENAGGE